MLKVNKKFDDSILFIMFFFKKKELRIFNKKLLFLFLSKTMPYVIC